MTDNNTEEVNNKKIIIQEDGPYMVSGSIPLVRKTQIVSEYGEPLTWQKGETIETACEYDLCRCGHTKKKPFCDDSHIDIGFDGKEVADARPTAQRQVEYPNGTKIVVMRDYSLCSESGFCGTRFETIREMMSRTEDTSVRAQIMAMIERCPSGSYTYAIEKGQAEVEPDLPQEIALITEITSDGPIDGPLWVTGYIPIERADGQPMETRNRVTLCCCGLSKNKPFCDGTHRPKEIDK